MTKKDYIRIAEILRGIGSHNEGFKIGLIERFAGWFAEDNPSFDKTKFEEAAGYCARVLPPDISYDDALGQTRN